MFTAMPTPVRVFYNANGNGDCPLTVREGRTWLEEFSKENVLNTDIIPKDKYEEAQKLVNMLDLRMLSKAPRMYQR